MTDRNRRHLLTILVVLTLGLLVADLAGSGIADGLRRASGTVIGPIQRALSGAPRDQVAAVEAENARLTVTVNDLQRQLAQADAVRLLLASPDAAGRQLIAARVVASELSPTGGRSVTIDAGARDGVEANSSVITADGLVGRVVSVSAWTSDVQVLGSTGSQVGVRVGPDGVLGHVSPASSADDIARPRGALTLEIVAPGTIEPGNVVTTLGSVDDRPYAAGLLVGSVTSVDPDRGRATRTATVMPFIDPDRLDIVGVLVTTPRSQPRPTLTGGATP